MRLKTIIAASIIFLPSVTYTETVELTDGRVGELREDGTFELVNDAPQLAINLEVLQPFFEPPAGEYNKNSIRFVPIVRNRTGKEIVGFQFSTSFISAFADEVFSLSGDSSKRIADGSQSSARTFYFFEDNQFMSGQACDKLKILEASGTEEIVTEVTAVVFTDRSLWRA
jgi:hypothetical protein